jgi:hypothetical protein
LTVIDGSSSWPVIMVASNAVPGQPAANGLGPETCPRSTLYGCAIAAAGIAAVTARTASMTRHRVLVRVAETLSVPSEGPAQ